MMRGLYALILLLSAYASGSHAQVLGGTDVLDVTDDRPHVEAHDWSQVNVLPGGAVSWLYTYDNSSVTVNAGGEVSWLYMHDDSSVAVGAGAELSWLYLYAGSSATVSTAAAVSWLTVLDQGSALVNGGTVSRLGVFGSATAEVRGGTISYLTLSQASTVDIYGYDFEFDGFRLEGRWRDGTSFDFRVSQAEEPHRPVPPGEGIPLPSNLRLNTVTPGPVGSAP